MSEQATTSEAAPAPVGGGRLRRWLRRTAYALLALWFLAGGLFLLVREVVVPRLGDYREQIAALASRNVGLPVQIEGLRGDWAGLRPRLHLTGLTLLDEAGRPALRLPQVDATLSWSSLLRLELRFHRLEISSPEVAVRREADGGVVVAGVRLGGGPAGGGFADWLLAQHQVVVHGAALNWTDEMRSAPPLALKQVEFLLERRLLGHRFALQAQPPEALASTLDLRGEFSHLALDEPAQTRGRLYLALERADLGGWTPWVDYPLPLQGQGGLRAWVNLDGAERSAMEAELALEGVVTRLGEDLPELRLQRLQGQLAASRKDGTLALSTRQLSLSAEGLQIAPTDFALTLGEAGGSLQVNQLDFAALAGIAAHLPLEDGVRSRLAAFDPRGSASNVKLEWRGQAAAPESWKLAARFDGIGLAARDSLPGLGGLSGSLEGDERSGRFQLAGQDTHIDLPEVFDNARLSFASFKADGGWSRRDGRLEIALDSAGFDNADAAGTASGRYWPEAGGPGEIDLQARLTRAEGTSVWRYLPRVVNRDTHEWVQHAIRRAAVPDARLRLKGKLHDFPYRQGEGQFLVTIKVADAELAYAPGWPEIQGIYGEVRFEGPGLKVEAAKARILGVNLANVVAEVADLDAHGGEIMTINGRAAGPTAEFLRFVSGSPVAERINRFTDDMRAEGNGNLDLRLVMPLRSVRDTTVRGDFRFAANRLWLVSGLPPLDEAAGRLRFTADQFSVSELQAKVLGEPLQMTASTGEDGSVAFAVSGTAGAAALQREYGWPVLDHLSGATPWQTQITVARSGTKVNFHTDLAGISSSLPAPFNKPATDKWPLAVVADYPAGSATSSLKVDFGERLQAAFERSGGKVVRGGIGIAQPARMAEKGVMVAAVADQLDIDAWRHAVGLEGGQDNAAKAADGAALAAAMPLAGVALQAEQLKLFGQSLAGVRLRAVADPGGWKARLDSDKAQGDFDWREAGNGSVMARFKRLVYESEAESGAEHAAQHRGTEVEPPPRSLPGLDVVAEQFVLRGLELGRLEVNARNRGGEWLLERFSVANPDGRLAGSGVWQTAGAQRTRLKFKLETDNIGRFTRRMGYPDTVRGGQATLEGQLGWHGAPTRIDYPSLAGEMKVEAGGGQFNKLDPGVGRLLGILSLQALPRRITLDFRDVFSEGFAFDRISGDIDINGGVMRTENLEIRGAAARVQMRGAADVGAETQDLRVTVQPTLSESVAIGAAAGLINPVAGVVTYLAQKALSDPFERLFAYDYTITGTWDDPKVEKLGSTAESLIPRLPDTSGPPAASESARP